MNDALGKLLGNPHIWRGRADGNARQGLSTGYPRLDEHLPGGGWPRAALTEILLERYGSGELELLMPALARLSRGDFPWGHSVGAPTETSADAGWIAWIAPPFQPYPPALWQWGVDLARVLIVRPRSAIEGLWAAEQALACGNCAAVLVWSEVFDTAAGRRLQLAAEEGASWAIVFRPSRARGEHSAAALRLELVNGAAGTDLHILKSRGGRPAAVPGIVHDYASFPHRE